MQLTEQLLEKFAQHVVGRFLTEKLALNDGVVDTAQKEGLNPEQIKRLVEAVNTAVFLHKFNNPEDKGDRMVEFETADPNAVMNRLLTAAKDEMVADAPPTDDSEGQMDLYRDLPATRENIPASEPTAPEVGSSESEPLRVSDILKLRKTAELLRDRTYQNQVVYTETLKDLATDFTRLDAPSFETFEKDVLYKHGSAAAPFLGLLRGSLRMEPAHYDAMSLTKIARVIDSRQPVMQKFAKLMETYQEIDRSRKAMIWVNERLGKQA